MAERIGSLKQLQELNATGMMLGAEGAVALVQAVRGLRGLTGLMLSQNGLAADSTMTLAAWLAPLRQLRWIELSRPCACESGSVHAMMPCLARAAPWIHVSMPSESA